MALTDPDGNIRLTIGTDGDPTQAWAGDSLEDARAVADALTALGSYTGSPALHLSPEDVLPLAHGHELRAFTIHSDDVRNDPCLGSDAIRRGLERLVEQGLRITAVVMRADRLRPSGGSRGGLLLSAARGVLAPDATVMCDWAGDTTEPGNITILAIAERVCHPVRGIGHILGERPVDDSGVVRLDDGRFEATGRLYRPDRTPEQTKGAIEATVRRLVDNGHLPSDWDYQVDLASADPVRVEITATAPKGAWLYHADLAQVRADAAQGQPNAIWIIGEVRDHYGQADDTHVQAFLDTLRSTNTADEAMTYYLQTPTGRRVHTLLNRVRMIYGHRTFAAHDTDIRVTIKEREGSGR
ncbi:MAG: hypothetical protein UHD09_09225 [Bifidobacterium sp.]|nr:hypothetical protein [Bifidobacterium sp.]